MASCEETHNNGSTDGEDLPAVGVGAHDCEYGGAWFNTALSVSPHDFLAKDQLHYTSYKYDPDLGIIVAESTQSKSTEVK